MRRMIAFGAAIGTIWFAAAFVAAQQRPQAASRGEATWRRPEQSGPPLPPNEAQPQPDHREGVQRGAAVPLNQSTDPILRAFSFRSIGPAVMMGRLDDIEGPANDANVLYIGFATGGVWKTTDGGNHWQPVFDAQPNDSIGAIGVAANDPNIVYVGTGEANNRQSSTIGDGIWGSTDGGVHWTHLGLADTQTIARIAVDPADPEIVYVAALGHLFGPNRERGLYKTVNGGKTWQLVKYIDQNTGFTDVALDPQNPRVVYAASYERRRTWFGFNGGGAGSGLWKSSDAGATWLRLDGPGWPHPSDSVFGRIGIAIFRARPSTLYAQVEAGVSAALNSDVGADGLLWRGGPNSSEPGGTETASRAGAPRNPNASGTFRSDDGGQTWTFESNQNQRPLYFSRIAVDPVNPDKVLVGGEEAEVSLDGGKTWRRLAGSHADYHAIWISPNDPRFVALGNDGGLDTSRDGGVTFEHHNHMGALGQFYHLSADMRRPYWICGGLQDNSSWCGPSALRSNAGPTNSDWFTVAGGDGYSTAQDPTHWATVYGGSQWGVMSRINLRTGESVSIRPVAAGGGGRGSVVNVVNATNVDTVTNRTLRFNSNAAFEMSPHNPDELYTGAQYFFKSLDRGNTWWVNPEDLTRGVNRFSAAMNILGVPGDRPMEEKYDGVSNVSNIVQIKESPARPGVIWVGTDDGNLQLSLDGGQTFTNVIGKIHGAPSGYVQISRIAPSHFAAGAAYVALDNHRNDDWRPYLFKTTDFGRTWSSIASNLPAMGPVTALVEDPRNPDLLFAGTEFGLYASLDDGATWNKFMNGMPDVPVYSLLIHPRDRDLIVGTHGRSIWIADDITPLEQWRRVGTHKLVLFDPRPAVEWRNQYTDYRGGTQGFRGQNPQGGTAISVYAASDLGPGAIAFLQNGQLVSSINVTVHAGLNRFQWNLEKPLPPGRAARGRGRGGAAGFGGRRGPVGVPFVARAGRGFGPQQVAPGAYMVRLTVAGQTRLTSVTVLADTFSH
ncbi:MAG: WD40/YVTN/BNR-like repeat-containing protein [Terriglobales bacterium]